VVTFGIEARRYPLFGWVIVEVSANGIRLSMMLNTGSSFSAINERAREALIQAEALPPERLTRYTLTKPSLAGNQLSDLAVRVLGQGLPRADLDGILGLDFLQQFSEISFEVATFRLTLALP